MYLFLIRQGGEFFQLGLLENNFLALSQSISSNIFTKHDNVPIVDQWYKRGGTRILWQKLTIFCKMFLFDYSLKKIKLNLYK